MTVYRWVPLERELPLSKWNAERIAGYLMDQAAPTGREDQVRQEVDPDALREALREELSRAYMADVESERAYVREILAAGREGRPA